LYPMASFPKSEVANILRLKFLDVAEITILKELNCVEMSMYWPLLTKM